MNVNEHIFRKHAAWMASNSDKSFYIPRPDCQISLQSYFPRSRSSFWLVHTHWFSLSIIYFFFHFCWWMILLSNLFHLKVCYPIFHMVFQFNWSKKTGEYISIQGNRDGYLKGSRTSFWYIPFLFYVSSFFCKLFWWVVTDCLYSALAFLKCLPKLILVTHLISYGWDWVTVILFFFFPVKWQIAN